jgi:NAD(P)-dependent dehydrogenase (short-subunit alcohol dehydrogenase family)
MNQAVIVTGALGGIGRALCEEFYSHGFRVIALDKADGNVSAHLNIKTDIRNLVKDKQKLAELQNHISLFLNTHKINLKGLINNAAVQILASTKKLTVADWEETIETNLLAPFILSKTFLDELELAKGSIINISSIHEKLTKPSFVAYATSKSALSGLTRAMAVDLAGKVRVNAICPAAIGTSMLVSSFEKDADGLAVLGKVHPSGRIGMPEEVAQLARYLVCDSPEFLNGSCLGLDGGIAGRLHDPD